MLKNVTHKDSLLNADQFSWFTGVVENIMDPLELGKIQVRCIGYHTENKEYIPTFTLPWATIAQPPGMSSFSSFGLSTTGIQQGTWVVGFFKDGQNAQDPVIIGALPGNVVIPNYDYGFSDPFKQFPLTDSQLTKDGTPIAIRNTLDQPREATSKYKETFSFEEKATIYNELDFSFSDGLRDLGTYGRSILHTNNPLYPDNIVLSTRPKIARSGFDSIELTKSDGVHSDVIRKKLYLEDDKPDTRSVESRFMQNVSENDFTKDFERKTDIHLTGTLREWNHLGEEYKNVVSSKNERVGNDKITIVKENSVETVGRNKIENVDGNYSQIITGNTRIIQDTSNDLALGKRNITTGDTITEKRNGYNLENDDWEISKSKDISCESNFLSQRYTGGKRTHLGNSDVKLNLGRSVENVNITDLNRVKKHRQEFVGKLGRGGSSLQGSASMITIGEDIKQQVSKGYNSDTKEFFKGFHDTLVWGTREDNVRMDVTEWYEQNHNHSVVGVHHTKIMGDGKEIAKQENVYNQTKYEYHSEVTEYHQRDYLLHVGKPLDEAIFDEYPFLDEDRRFCERPGVPLAEAIEPEGNRFTIIELDDDLHVKANRISLVNANDSLTVGGNRSMNVAGNTIINTAVATAITTGAGMAITTGAAMAITTGAVTAITSGVRTIIDGFGYPRGLLQTTPPMPGAILYLDTQNNWIILPPPVSATPAVLGFLPGGVAPIWVQITTVPAVAPGVPMTLVPV